MPEPIDWPDALQRSQLTVPVDDRVVALVRLPVAITPLVDVTKALSAAYGPDLVFRTDTGLDGWAVISRPAPGGEQPNE